ncbi:cullin family [Ceratobasidium sp. AG-Ba]|nr:cullin family [Ceratobasidium sp. AG-Ba]
MAINAGPIASSSRYDPERGRTLAMPGPPPASDKLETVWAFVQPALDHILTASSPGSEPARIDAAYYSHIYTALYNLSTAAPNSRADSGAGGALAGLASLRLFGGQVPRYSPTGKHREIGPNDSDAVADQIDHGPYLRLEDTFRRHAQGILDAAPVNDSQLVDYLLAQYDRYNRSAAYIARLFSYLHRHFVRRMVAAGHGWLDTAPRETISELVRSPPLRRPTEREIEERITNEIQARRLAELKKWGYSPGSNVRSRETEAAAEACAEAASSPGKIVPVISLALRQWRTEVLEPLTVDGRLPRAVILLVRRPSSKDKIPERVQRMLKSCGVRGVDPSRKTLKRHLQPHK